MPGHENYHGLNMEVHMLSGTVFSFGSDLGFYFLITFGLFWGIIAILGLIVVFEDLAHSHKSHLRH